MLPSQHEARWPRRRSSASRRSRGAHNGWTGIVSEGQQQRGAAEGVVAVRCPQQGLVSATMVVLGFSISNLPWWHEAWRIERRADTGVFRLSLAFGVLLREGFTNRLRVVLSGYRAVLRHAARTPCAHTQQYCLDQAAWPLSLADPFAAENSHTAAVSQEGIASRTSANTADTTPLIGEVEEQQLLSSSLPYTANTSARRRCRDTAVLYSPARRGHSACMRQIFDVNQQPALYARENQDVIYPALSNVSRQRSPFNKHPVADIPTAFQCTANGDPVSSESWHDDLGYLHGDAQCVSTRLASSPDGKVNDWLSATDDDSSESTNAGMSEHASQPEHRQHITPNERNFKHDTPSNSPMTSPRQSLVTTPTHRHRRAVQDNMVVYSCTSPTDRGGLGLEELQLSPLSPNVCTERGPSRYHESRRARVTIDTSPTKTKPVLHLQQRPPQENISPRTIALPEAKII
ncbi:hypothetical protein SVAN01_01817 [Stagonosporopsis vannaccii]|nr:hypothetical protein SVAN01_01817 [Stagonosporopsis vannaccii]